VLAGDKSAIALVYPYRCVLCSSVTRHGAEESHLREAGQRETAVIAGPPPFQAEIPEDVEQRHPQSLLDPGQPHHRKGGVHFPLHLGRVACQGGERQQRIFVASQFPELSGAQPSHQGDLRGEVEVRNADPSDWTDLIGKMKVCDDVDAKHLSPIKQNHQLAVRPEMFADTPVRVISARD
jgi:hypothetical protein